MEPWTTQADLALPRINKPAPAFETHTTHGMKRIEDYRGKWLVLFSDPADFTPVCTTEVIAFARHYGEFQALNTELIGLPIDNYQSHLAWVQNIKDMFGVEVPFPIIEDLSMRVTRAYGMPHMAPTDVPMQATFIIDPESILRVVLHNPMTDGRSFPELQCLIRSLQVSRENSNAPPALRPPYAPAMVPPARIREATATAALPA